MGRDGNTGGFRGREPNQRSLGRYEWQTADRHGSRGPMAMGSIVAASSSGVIGVIIGRALQGVMLGGYPRVRCGTPRTGFCHGRTTSARSHWAWMLRRVERYGITSRGEQYAGFRAVPAAGPEVVYDRFGAKGFSATIPG